MSVHAEGIFHDDLVVEIEGRFERPRMILRDEDDASIRVTGSEDDLRRIALAILTYLATVGQANRHLWTVYGEIGPAMADAYDREEQRLAAQPIPDQPPQRPAWAD